MTSQEYILSVLKLPFSDEDKAAMITKLIDAGIKAGVDSVTGTTIGKAPVLQAQPAPPVVAPDLLIPKPATPPVAALPPPVSVPASGVTFHAENGLRVDDKVAPGTPGTVTLPATGHVVSLPSAGAGKMGGELAMGYQNRVKLQLDAADLVNRANFVLVQGWAPTAQRAGLDTTNLAHWPEIADRVCNASAYQTQAQKDAEALARQQMITGMHNVGATPVQQAAPPPDGDTVPVPFENR